MVYNFDLSIHKGELTRSPDLGKSGRPPNLKFGLGITAWSILGESVYTDFPIAYRKSLMTWLLSEDVPVILWHQRRKPNFKWRQSKSWPALKVTLTKEALILCQDQQHESSIQGKITTKLGTRREWWQGQTQTPENRRYSSKFSREIYRCELGFGQSPGLTIRLLLRDRRVEDDMHPATCCPIISSHGTETA